jgi:hypothetical protein
VGDSRQHSCWGRDRRHEQLAHLNAVSTGGRDEGALAFRWFLAESVPARPAVEVVKVADAPTDTL